MAGGEGEEEDAETDVACATCYEDEVGTGTRCVRFGCVRFGFWLGMGHEGHFAVL